MFAKIFSEFSLEGSSELECEVLNNLNDFGVENVSIFDLAQVIELNREIQAVEPPSGLLDVY